MISITSIIATRAPEYSSDSRLSDMIALATEQTTGNFGTKQNMAIALLTLHWFTLEGMGGSGGSLIKEKEGDLARSYGSVSMDTGLEATKYGRELIALRRSSFVLPTNRMI